MAEYAAGPYYGGAPNAFAGGMEYGAARRLRQVHENALNALIQMYGPTAADPEAAAALQGIQQNAEMQPYRAARAKLENDALVSATQDHDNEQRLAAAKRAANVLSVVKAKNGDIGQAFDFISATLPKIGIPADQLGTIRQTLIDHPEAVDEFTALLKNPDNLKAMSGGQAFYDNEGKYGPKGALVWGIPTAEGGVTVVQGLTPATAQQAGVRLQQGAERIGVARSNTARGWAKLQLDKVKMFMPKTAEGVGYEPGPNYANDPSDVVAHIAPGSPAAQKFSENLQKASGTDRKFITAYQDLSARNTAAETAIDRALQFFDNASPGVLQQSLRKGEQHVPGTDAFNAATALETLKANVPINELMALRQSNPGTGVSIRVTNAEMGMLANSLGNLRVENDPKRVAADLRNIKNIYQKAIDAAKQDADEAQYRMQLREQGGLDDGTTAPAATTRAPAKPAAKLGPHASLDELLNHYAPETGH